MLPGEKSEKKLHLENICLLLAHIVMADGVVDEKERLLIQDFIAVNALGHLFKNELNKIFEHAEDRITLDETFRRLKNAAASNQEQAVIAGLLIAYGDGEYHASEERILQNFIQYVGFDRQRYEQYRYIAAKQQQEAAAGHS